MLNELRITNGRVVLIAGGGKTFCDLATRFCGTKKDIEELIAAPQDKQIIKEIINSAYTKALEFDDFIFGIQGYSHLSEIQINANCISSSIFKNGKYNTNVVIPDSIRNFHSNYALDPAKVCIKFSGSNGITRIKLNDYFPLLKQQFAQVTNPTVIYEYGYRDILNIIDNWYTEGVNQKLPEEDLQYMKPQGMELKAIVKISAINLRNLACEKMCNKTNFEIRDIIGKMVKLAKNVAPELMEGIGPSCAVDGFCNKASQCAQLKGQIPTKQQVLDYIADHKNEILNY